jgi:hypothetical protein
VAGWAGKGACLLADCSSSALGTWGDKGGGGRG